MHLLPLPLTTAFSLSWGSYCLTSIRNSSANIDLYCQCFSLPWGWPTLLQLLSWPNSKRGTIEVWRRFQNITGIHFPNLALINFHLNLSLLPSAARWQSLSKKTLLLHCSGKYFAAWRGNQWAPCFFPLIKIALPIPFFLVPFSFRKGKMNWSNWLLYHLLSSVVQPVVEGVLGWASSENQPVCFTLLHGPVNCYLLLEAEHNPFLPPPRSWSSLVDPSFSFFAKTPQEQASLFWKRNHWRMGSH